MFREYFTQLKRKAEHLNWGSEIVVDFVSQHSPNRQAYTILDIGPGEGFDITNAKNALLPAKISMYGVECKGVSTAKFFNNKFLLLAGILLVCLQRTEKKGTFLEALQSRFFETNYFSG